MVKNYKHKLISTSLLIPYINNSRIHSVEQIKQVASSIKEFGFTNPILIDENNGVIAGHGRLLAAEHLKIDKVPCIILDGLSEAQKKAYVIADNQLAKLSEWNESILKDEIESIASFNFDIDILSFSDKELSKLFDEMGGVTISENLNVVDFDELTVKFNHKHRVEVMNSIHKSLSDICGFEIWCDNEQV